MKRLLLIFLVLLPSVFCIGGEVALRSFLSNNLQFRADVFKRALAQKEDNLFFSPMGVTFVMSFLSFGAKSSTLDEIRQTLNLPQNSRHLQMAIKTLRGLVAQSQQSKLVAFIKVFLDDGFLIKDQFQEATRNVFVNCCDVGHINFMNSDAANEINQWSNMYNDTRIIVNQSECNSQTRLLPVNPLYFTANWLHPFESANTKPRDFYVSQSKTSKVDAMQVTSYFNYFESAELDSKIIELKFDGKEAGFLIVLPNQKNGLQSLEAKIEQFDLMRMPQTKKRLRVILPKFTIRTTTKLRPILNQMGIVKAFDRHQADLSSLSGRPGDLFLTDIIQKAFITVDEHGVLVDETLVKTSKSFLSLTKSLFQHLDPSSIEDFVVDHPFIFHIKLHGVSLFAGRVIDPSH